MKVLVIDDDVDLIDLLTYVLRRDGYNVLTALDGLRGLQRWENEEPDIVLLDSMLPKLDGLEVCRRIRQESRTPIIILSERVQEEDVVNGLRTGADDYIKKPFSPKELSARMEAVLRRCRTNAVREQVTELRVGNLVLDVQSHTASNAGEPVQLTVLEFRLLYILALNEGSIVPYSRLIEYAWGYYDSSNSNALKTHICHIRRKLNLSPGRRTGSLRVIQGVGYRLICPPIRVVSPPSSTAAAACTVANGAVPIAFEDLAPHRAGVAAAD
jgi:DNA-binding response OmpR family regulator